METNEEMAIVCGKTRQPDVIDQGQAQEMSGAMGSEDELPQDGW
jgi:hypothetical protein